MNYLRMAIALVITFWLIIKVLNKIDDIIPICVVYYFGTVLNDIFRGGQPLELANVFGVSCQWGDTLMIIFAGTLVVDVFRKHILKKDAANLFLLLICVLVLSSAIRGIQQYGITSEWIGDFRTFGNFVFAILFFARYYINIHIANYVKLIDCTMLIILFISIILWGLDLVFGIHPLLSQYNATLSDGGSTMRFIQSAEVLVMALYALYLVRKDILTKNCIGIRAFAFILAVILFQHRSVWLALIAGLLVIAISELKERKLSINLLFQILAVIALGLAVILFSNGAITFNIRKSFVLFYNILTGGPLTYTTTATRFAIWKSVFADLMGIAALIGRPFGCGYARLIGWKNSPHSGYIRLLARTGYAGAILTSLFLVFLCVKLIKNKRTDIVNLFVCMLVFMLAYDFTWSCGIILGCGCAILNRNKSDISKETLKL